MNIKLLKIGSVILILLATGIVFSQFSNSFNARKVIELNEITSEIFMEGDIIFQTSNSTQSRAIQIATNSIYSHVGIIMNYKGKLVVLEAVQPIKYTPIKDWIRHGEKSYYSLKRLKNRDNILTEASLKKMRKIGNSWIGKNYDIAFEWSDKKLYCSELVWKIYKEGCGIDVGELKELKQYNLSHPIVKKALEQRYGKNIPWEENMISPQAIYDSQLLKTIL